MNSDATQEALAALTRTREARDPGRVTAALEQLTRAARDGTSMMDPSTECAHARVTTGEWADALRDVFGEYRAPTGVGGQSPSLDSSVATELARRVAALAKARGRRPRLVVAKPGLDGHSNGAEVIAVAGRQSGFDVVYDGIRLSCQAIVQSAVEEDADLIGLSILSGSHLELCKQLINALEGLDAADIPVVVGGIIPQEDHDRLRAMGIAQIFTPRDSSLGDVMTAIVDLIEAQ